MSGSSPSTNSARTEVAAALRAATSHLSATSDTPRLDAELLMAFALGVSRSDLLLRHMRDPAPAGFAAMIKCRAAHEPVAYITGEAEFWGRTFRVTPATLIPRPDSETLIRAALEAAPRALRVLDLGTGSGALLLTYLAETDASGVGIDASGAACAVAAENAARLDLAARAAILHRSWREPAWQEGLGTFDLILCNPPYVEDGADLAPDVRNHEPASALFAGPEGLDVYQILLPQIRALLNPDAVAVFEIGHTQAQAVAAIARSNGFVTEQRHDLAGRVRALILG